MHRWPVPVFAGVDNVLSAYVMDPDQDVENEFTSPVENIVYHW